MKKAFALICILALMIITANVEAVENKVKKGTSMVGADTAFYYTYDSEKEKEEESKTTTVSDNAQLNATYGYFIFDGLEIGPTGGIMIQQKKTTYENYTETFFMPYGGIGAQIGIWIFTDSDFYPFVSLSILYTYMSGEMKENYKNNSDGEDVKYKLETTGYWAEPEIGFSYFVTKEAAINAGVSYEIQNDTGTRKIKSGGNTNTQDYSDKTTTIGFDVGIGLFF